MQFFGVDVLDIARGGVSLRRLTVLVLRLLAMPGKSALAAAMVPHAAWSTSHHLTAELIDRLELANWLTLRINSEGQQMDPPAPFPRPGMESPATEDTFASALEVHTFLQQLSA